MSKKIAWLCLALFCSLTSVHCLKSGPTQLTTQDIAQIQELYKQERFEACADRSRKKLKNRNLDTYSQGFLWFYLGLSQRHLGNTDLEHQAFVETLQTDYLGDELFDSTLKLLLVKKNAIPKEALGAISERLLALPPSDFKLELDFAAYCTLKNREDIALPHLERLLETDQAENPLLLRRLFNACLRLNQRERFLKAVNNARSKGTIGEIAFNRLLGDYYYQQAERKKALTYFNNVLALDPKDVDSLRGKASIFFYEGKDSYIPIMEKVLELEPEEPNNYAKYIHFLTMNNEFDRARDILNRLAQVPRFSPEDLEGIAYSIEHREMDRTGPAVTPDKKDEKHRYKKVALRFRSSEKALYLTGLWDGEGRYSVTDFIRNLSIPSSGGVFRLDLRLDRDSPYLYRYVVDNDTDPGNGYLFSGKISPDTTRRAYEYTLHGPIIRTREPYRFAPGDGHSKVLALIFDGESWNIMMDLLLRGRAPAFQTIYREGAHGIMYSIHPHTAICLIYMTTFHYGNSYDLLSQMYDWGLQVKGLEDYAGLDLDFLSRYMPEQKTLWVELGRHGVSYASMLFGDMYAGHIKNDLTVTGRDGTVRRVVIPPLADKDYPKITQAAIFGGKAEPDSTPFDIMKRFLYKATVQTAALESVVEKERPDFILFRYPTTDLAHHRFHGLSQMESDNLHTRILSNFLEYIHDLLLDVFAFYDQDDYIILLSDHGNLNNYEHAKDAIFMAHGPGIRKGNIPQFTIYDIPYFFESIFTPEKRTGSRDLVRTIWEGTHEKRLAKK